MLKLLILVVLVGGCVDCVPYPEFLNKSFKVGIEYDHSLPMSAGSDRVRHKNNYDSFFITVIATARKGYVLDYLEVETTTDLTGEVDFCLIQGKVGSKNMVFQLSSNNSDFLSYNYRAYGIKEKEFIKINNILQIPMPGSSTRAQTSVYLLSLIVLPFIRSIYLS